MNNLNGNPNFIATGSRIVIFQNSDRSGIGNWRTVGEPIEQGTAQAWDGVDASFAQAISSRIDGVVSFCKITVTGRSHRRFGWDLTGVAATVEFSDGTKAAAVIPANDPMIDGVRW